MKTNLLLILVFIGFACSSPKAKEADTKNSTKTENVTQNKTKQAPDTQTQPENSTPIVKGDVKMEFTINGLNADGKKIKLIGQFVDKKYLADSATIATGGKFGFEGDELFPKGFYYIVLPNNSVIKILLDEDQVFKFSADASDIDGTAKIEGSETMKLYYDDFKFKKSLDSKYGPIARKIGRMSPSDPEFKSTYKEFLKLSKKYDNRNKQLMKDYPNNFFVKFKIGGKNPLLTFPKNADGSLDTHKQVEAYREHFWDDFDFNEPGLINTPAFTNKMKRYFSELVGQMPDELIKYTDVLLDKAKHNPEYFKVITNWIALKYEPGKTKLMDGEAVYSHIILKYFTKDKATWLDDISISELRKRANEMTQSLLNKPMGDVTARGYNGKIYTLSKITAPVIIVYIYSPDCSHCEEETPRLKQFYSKWKNKGVEIFSIAANATDSSWKAFHERFDLPWPDVFDASNASWYPKYFVDVTPEIYVIDKNRKIFAKNLKVSQLETIMSRINK